MYSIELSVVIPVFNEEDSIQPLITRVREALATFPSPWELILVDDGSTDRTLANARKALSDPDLDLKIVELQKNFGQTAAMQAGIDSAAGRLIATLDGDLQNDPADIPEMVKAIEERELDLLVGWRKNRQDGLLLRKVPSWCANRLIGKITGVRLHDYGCSLKVYRTSVIKQVKRGRGPAWPWLQRLAAAKPAKLAAVALANKVARIAWKMMTSGEEFALQRLAAAA